MVQVLRQGSGEEDTMIWLIIYIAGYIMCVHVMLRHEARTYRNGITLGTLLMALFISWTSWLGALIFLAIYSDDRSTGFIKWLNKMYRKDG